MGAPIRITLEDRFLRGRPPTVLIGKQVHVEDIPRKELYTNFTDSHSDPNFIGAFDHEKICYDRTITVEVAAFLGIFTDEYPDLYNENIKTVKLTREVYEQLQFEVPRDERTDGMRRKKGKKRKSEHVEEVKKMNELEYPEMVYLVYGSKYEETELSEKKTLVKLIRKAGSMMVRV